MLKIPHFPADEELIETLSAISIVSLRLAKNLQAELEAKESRRRSPPGAYDPEDEEPKRAATTKACAECSRAGNCPYYKANRRNEFT